MLAKGSQALSNDSSFTNQSAKHAEMGSECSALVTSVLSQGLRSESFWKWKSMILAISAELLSVPFLSAVAPDGRDSGEQGGEKEREVFIYING